LFFILDGADR